MANGAALDPRLSLALAVQAHKGVYVMLLGSGLSSGAGVPTGWGVALDLVKRLAIAGGAWERAQSNLEAWYREKFGQEPSYSHLLSQLAQKSSERQSLLRPYFEPSDEEKDEGKKLPTEAHRAIARLVTQGYVKVIITTNFDRLLERAIQAEGVSPVVVSSGDHVDGMMPLQHVRCLVLKLHGDYLDTRLLNTADELCKYDPRIEALLDRTLSEYGLIVCGWSAEWDEALRAAILRTTRHRFTTYWMTLGELTERARELAQHRQAVVLRITSADEAFHDLEERVQAIENGLVLSPISAQIAVAMVKRYVADERNRVLLEDLVHREVRVVLKGISELHEHVGPAKGFPYVEWVQRLTALCSRLVPMLAVGVLHGRPEHDPIWFSAVRALGRLLPISNVYSPDVRDLEWYPAALAYHAIGTMALVRGRYGLLKVLLVDTSTSKDNDEREPTPFNLAAESVIHTGFGQSLYPRTDGQRKRTPGSDWVFDTLSTMLNEIIPPDVVFEQVFDEFEIIASLASMSLGGPAHVGRYAWRRYQTGSTKLLSELPAAFTAQGGRHPLLAAGLFQGDPEKAVAILEELLPIVHQRSF